MVSLTLATRELVKKRDRWLNPLVDDQPTADH
jgi:hypothetical protein